MSNQQLDFSFILPSRGNEKDLLRFLDSLERTTFNKDKIEVLLAVDEGRDDIQRFVNKQQYSYSIRIYERPETDDFTNDYYNWLANRSTGKHLWVFNDDAWIKTLGWDKKILDAVSKTGWSIYFVDVLDSARVDKRQQFPCFPMVSRRAYCLLGFVLFPPVKIYPADQFTHDIYHSARRIVSVNNVMVQHDHKPECTDPAKSKMMRVLLEQRPLFYTPEFDGSEHVVCLLKACSTDFNKTQTKIQRIINIIKEK